MNGGGRRTMEGVLPEDKLRELLNTIGKQEAKNVVLRARNLTLESEVQDTLKRFVASENDRAHLLAQVTELQSRMSEMMNTQRSRRVRAFHQKFGHPVETTPHVPEKAQVQFRLSLIAEEFFELLAACEIWPTFHMSGVDGDVEHKAADIVKRAIQFDFSGVVDLPEFADAMEDLDYVIEGTRAVFGINGDPLAAEVQRANMEKDAVYVEAKDDFHKEGQRIKPTKPKDWKAPDIKGALEKQGWKP